MIKGSRMVISNFHKLFVVSIQEKYYVLQDVKVVDYTWTRYSASDEAQFNF